VLDSAHSVLAVQEPDHLMTTNIDHRESMGADQAAFPHRVDRH
jgi:hypothetical protein